MSWIRQPTYYQNPWIRWLIAHGWEGPPPSPLQELFGAHAINPRAFNPQPDPPGAPILYPEPEPWRIAVLQLLQAAQAKDLAARLPDERLKQALERSAGGAINSIIDDWCGTPPKYPYPWPWPGPPPWVWEMVSELSLVANSLQAGSLRDGIQQVATQALQKASAEA
jgi:hypothetical protein